MALHLYKLEPKDSICSSLVDIDIVALEKNMKMWRKVDDNDDNTTKNKGQISIKKNLLEPSAQVSQTLELKTLSRQQS